MLPPLLGLALAIIAVLVAGRGRGGNIAAAVCVAAGAYLAWRTTGVTWQRLGMVTFPFLALLAVVRMAPGGREWTVGRRVWQLWAFFDVRDARPAPSRFPVGEWAALLGHIVLFAVAAVTLARAPAPSILVPALRLVAGAAMIYALVGTLDALTVVVHATVGIRAPAMQNAPLRSRSLAEFWGRRWNRAIAGWLRDYVYAPVVRRYGRRIATWCVFGVSALIHFWLTWIPVSLIGGIRMGGYFLIAGGLLAIESLVRPGRWPEWAARTWTIGAVVLPMAIAVDVFLAVFSL